MDKPLPDVTPETAPFWEKARAGELWLPCCLETGQFFFPPRAFSPFTGGAIEWRPASGRATLASFNIAYRPAPGFQDDAPYIVAIAELEEGPKMLTNLPGAPPDPAMLKIGAALEISFEARGDFAIPQFRLADAA